MEQVGAVNAASASRASLFANTIQSLLYSSCKEALCSRPVVGCITAWAHAVLGPRCGREEMSNAVNEDEDEPYEIDDAFDLSDLYGTL